jgi:hypothetical protein
MERTTATIEDRTRRHATNLAWAHAVLFGVIALACYVSPETTFGDGAYLPLPRLAVLAFAAALVAVVIVLVGSARSGSPSSLKLALLAALAVDVQLPIAIFAQTAYLEHLESDLGIPWFVVPLVFVVLVGVTVHCLLRLRRDAASHRMKHNACSSSPAGSSQ